MRGIGPLRKQDCDIAVAVSIDRMTRDYGAGDQGVMFGEQDCDQWQLIQICAQEVDTCIHPKHCHRGLGHTMSAGQARRRRVPLFRHGGLRFWLRRGA